MGNGWVRSLRYARTMLSLGVQSGPCPCFDLPTWPNLDLPLPRLPVDSRSHLEQIRARLSRQQ